MYKSILISLLCSFIISKGIAQNVRELLKKSKHVDLSSGIIYHLMTDSIYYIPTPNYTGDAYLNCFYRNDTILSIVHYEKGGKKSLIDYLPNGQKIGITNFNNNKIVGSHLTFDRDGTLCEMEYTDTFSLKTTCIILDSVGHLQNFYTGHRIGGVDVTFDSNFQIREKWEYIAGKGDSLVAHVLNYFGDTVCDYINNHGKEKVIIKLRNGTLIGKGYIYNAIFSCVGKWTAWYPNGQKKMEYEYSDTESNSKEGIWKYWSSDGKLLKEEEYLNNALVKKKEYKKHYKDEKWRPLFQLGGIEYLKQ